MKKQDKIKLDAVSGIDEKIVDEVTDKRIAFSKKIGSAVINVRKKFIAIGSIAASFVLVASVLLAVIIPLIGSSVPVYKGMTIRQETTPVLALDNSDFAKAAFKDEGIYFAERKKDEHKDHDDKPHNKIEDLVDIDISTDEEVKYYVKPGEKFIIEIHISNPNNYEIQSFTLNGKKYANYMFKDGSTMELLLLEVTAPDTSGYVEYTIDAIKYIDGTEIKDVDMSSGDKSIKAGIAYTSAPAAAITSQSISTTTAEFEIKVTDLHSLIGSNELSVYLSDGENIIAEKPLQVGDNTVTFDNLIMCKTYEYGVVAAFDMADGKDLHEEWLLKGTITTAGAFGISNAAPTQNSISFNVDKIGDVGTIKSISIYDAETDELVQESGADTRAFENLLSGHKYNIYIDFTYTLNGEEVEEWFGLKEIQTVAKTAPTVTFSEATSDKTSISYKVDTVDTDNILNITKVEILKGSETVKENGVVLNGKFEELLSNNAYTVKVTYTYDLNDGKGVITDSATKEITTVAKTAPTVTFEDINTTDTSIIGKYTVTDVDSLCTVTSVDIYKNGALVQNNASKEVNFAELESYTAYVVKVAYSFDLNDGAGVQNVTADYEFTTSPRLIFKNFSVINTSAVSEGDTIFLQINIENPNGVVYQKISVNGKEYDVVKNSSTATMLFCEIVNNGQFEGGETTLTVEKVIAELGSKSYTIEPKENNTSSVFINGKLTVESFEAVVLKDGKYVEVDYYFPSEKAYLMVTLGNKTGYNIDSITIYGVINAELIKVDNEHYLVPIINRFDEWIFYIDEIKYSQGSFSKTLILSESDSVREEIAYGLSSDTIQYISTPEDLLNMPDGYYELTNDIDLAGIEWHGKPFQGVFNGNGYSIKNMSLVGTVNETDMKLGLFSYLRGVVTNLNLVGARFIVKNELHNNEYSSTYFGGIAGYISGGSIINNCSIDETSYINVEASYVGGLGGFVEGGASVIIKNCKNYATITSEGGRVGGISGGGSGDIDIINCANYGSITSNGSGISAGITVGSYGNNFIKNCANFAAVSGEYGISCSRDKLYNCLTYKEEKLAELYAYTENCYIYGQNVTIEQLNSKEFYTETLGWDENIWNLDNLDVANGKYPTLK